jgi:magnesium transporter
LERLHRLRGDLLVLRKVLWPLREAIHSLIREPHPLLSEGTHYFLRDCYDHTVQLLDVVETYRELCADLREYHFAQVSTRTNEVMKVLTIISTIFIPLTFIVGVYGMNFDTRVPGNMPELEAPYGYPITMLVMLIIGVLLLIWFWRKGWLRREEY